MAPHIRAPTVLINFTEELAVNHHFGFVRLVMFQRDKSTITVLFFQIRPATGENVSVKINFENGHVEEAEERSSEKRFVVGR
jgi:hypothetical protein